MKNSIALIILMPASVIICLPLLLWRQLQQSVNTSMRFVNMEQKFLRNVRDETKAKFDALLKTALNKGAKNRSKSSQHLIEEDPKLNASESGSDDDIISTSAESESACERNAKTLRDKSSSDDSKATFTRHKGEGDVLSDKGFLLSRFLNHANDDEPFLIKEPPVPKPRQSKIISEGTSSNDVLQQEKVDDSPGSNSTGRTYEIAGTKLIGDVLIHKNVEESDTSETLKSGKQANGVHKDVIELEPIEVQTKKRRNYKKADISSASSKSNDEIIEIFQDSLKSVSTPKEEALELQPVSSRIKYENEMKPKAKKRTKIKQREETSLVENRYKYEKIISVAVHRTDKLKLDSFVIHPVVKVHFVNAETGEYLKKTDRNRPVVFYLETSDVTYLLPVITRNFNLQENRCLHAEWEETIIINEDFEYLTDPKYSVVIFFELLDFVTFSAASSQASEGWHKIAWAFLKVSALNVDEKLRLQLYRPGKLIKEVASKSEVFRWWKSKKLVPYPSTLYVTVKGTVSPEVVVETFRSKTPLQNERGPPVNLNHSEPDQSIKNHVGDLPRFKYEHEVFKLPNKLLTQLDSEEEGCFVLKFSHSGLYLACSVLIKDMYTIAVYSVADFDDFYQLPSHRELIYNIAWSWDDSFLLSSSADGTVSIWDLGKSTFLQMLPHPSFVYWCEIADDVNTVATCCRDNVLRVWVPAENSQKLEYVLHDELLGHKGYVTCVCFGQQAKLMFSSDSSGGIIEWKIDNTGDWNSAREIKIPELKGVVINQIILHKRGKRLIVHARDNVIRIVDVKDECVVHWLEGARNNRVRTFCCVTPCFSYVLAGSETGVLHVWNLSKDREIATYNCRKDSLIHCVDYNPKRNMLAFSHYERDVPIQVYVHEENIKSDVDLRTVDDLDTVKQTDVGKQKRTKGIRVKSASKTNLQNILEKIDKIIG